MNAQEVQTFAAVSTQVAGALQTYVEPATVVQDPGPELEKFVSSKKYEPGVMLALQQEVVEIRNEATNYGSLGNVPPEMQANVRNQMYLTSESFKNLAKSSTAPKLSAADAKSVANYKGFLDKSTRFIPTWVKVAVALALGLGTMIGWKRIVVTVGEKIGKTHLTYAQGASAEIMAMVTIGLARRSWPAGQHDACPVLRRRRNHGGEPERSADVHDSRYRARVDLHAAGCRYPVRVPVLAVQQAGLVFRIRTTQGPRFGGSFALLIPKLDSMQGDRSDAGSRHGWYAYNWPTMSLKAKIEAVIYASEEPVTLAQLTGLLGQQAQAELDRMDSAQRTLALEGASAGTEAEPSSTSFAESAEADNESAQPEQSGDAEDPPAAPEIGSSANRCSSTQRTRAD